MYWRLLLLLTGCCVGSQAAFDVKNAEIGVTIVGTVITITVPENPDVKSMFFSTEITDECAAGYIFAQSLNDSKMIGYRHDLKRELNVNDMLRVSGVFEINKQVLTHSYEFRIDANGQAIKQNTPNTQNTEVCTPIPTPSSDCPAESDETTDKCKGDLIYKENFDNSRLQFWNRAVYSGFQDDLMEFTAFVKDNIAVKDGLLHLEANLSEKSKKFYLPDCTVKNTKKKCGNYTIRRNSPFPAFRTAKLRSIGKQLKYGRYEIRAKLAKGNWLFPNIMLMPMGKDIDAKPEQIINIAYARGNDHLQDDSPTEIGGSMLFGSVMFMAGSGQLQEVKKSMKHKTGNHFGDDFHIYTMIWHKDRIIFKVDGTTYGTINDKMALKQLNTHTFYDLVLGLTVGGPHNFRNVVRKNLNGRLVKFTEPLMFHLVKEDFESVPWTQPRLVIDYVHVYATHPDEN